MQRRKLLQSILGAPAVFAVPGAAQERRIDETPKLALATADVASGTVAKFFRTEEERAAFRKLGEILMPAADPAPGANEADAAGFLDFLLAESPADRQALYREGVARLNRDARAKYSKPFGALTAGEAAPILAPLKEPWTYAGPSDPFACFLRAAKDDFWQATINSRSWAEAMSARSRGAQGVGQYWLPIE
jgi:hypothetical protein